MREPVLAFHPLSSLFPLIEVAEFDALPTLGSSVTKRHCMPLAQFAGPISGTPLRLPQRLEPGRAAIDHRPSRTSLGPACAIATRPFAIFPRKIFRRRPVDLLGTEYQVQVSHPAVGRTAALRQASAIARTR